MLGHIGSKCLTRIESRLFGRIFGGAKVSELQETIYRTLRRVAADERLDIPELADDHSLVDDLGFRSLHVARILALLEVELDFDPFASGELPITNVRTVADLSAAYAGGATTGRAS